MELAVTLGTPLGLVQRNWASPRGEAGTRYSVSREVPRSVLKSEKLLGTLDATPKVPRHTSLTETGLKQGSRSARLWDSTCSLIQAGGTGLRS